MQGLEYSEKEDTDMGKTYFKQRRKSMEKILQGSGQKTEERYTVGEPRKTTQNFQTLRVVIYKTTRKHNRW